MLESPNSLRLLTFYHMHMYPSFISYNDVYWIYCSSAKFLEQCYPPINTCLILRISQVMQNQLWEYIFHWLFLIVHANHMYYNIRGWLYGCVGYTSIFYYRVLFGWFSAETISTLKTLNFVKIMVHLKSATYLYFVRNLKGDHKIVLYFFTLQVKKYYF